MSHTVEYSKWGLSVNVMFSEEGAKKAKHASSEDDGHDDDENDY